MNPMMNDIKPPRSPEAPAEEMATPKPEAQVEPAGQPSHYTGPDQRCQYCEYFRDFQDPSCQKFKFNSDPEGHCREFETAVEEAEAGEETEETEEVEAE